MTYWSEADYEFMARYDADRERYAATVEDCRRMAEDDDRWEREQAAAAVAALGFTAEPIAILLDDAPADDPDDLPF
jgi:hypothetical protein